MAECGGIYAEDIVKNSQGTFGLVLQDAEETSDESESEDEVLKKGQIVVCWYPSGKEETLTVSKVKLADRALMPGDVVKFADPQKGKQKGFVSNMEVIGAIKILSTNLVLQNVDCKELMPLQDLISGLHVTMGPWLGVIQESHKRLVLRLKSGARCSLEGEQCSMLYDVTDHRDEDSPFYSASFYPGQMVAGPSRAFKEAKWLSGMKPVMSNNTHVKAVVEEAEVVACEVNWQVCGFSQHDSPDSAVHCMRPPDAMVTKDHLRRLNVVGHFKHGSIQLGDKAFYTVKDGDISDSVEGQNSNSCNSRSQEQSSATNPAEADKESDGRRDDSERNSCGDTAADQVAVCDSDAVDGTGDKATISQTDTGKVDSKTEAGKKRGTTAPETEDSSRMHCQEGRNTDAAVEEEHDHVGVSDSGDADDDSDGGNAVAPKSKGAGSGAHRPDAPSAPPMRYPMKRRKKRSRRRRKTAPQLKVKAGDKVCVEVVSTHTTVDVTWQDSSKQKALLSTDLLPVFHLDELEFFPGDYVTDKRDKPSAAPTPAAYGVVLKTEHESRTCHVKWFTREGLELTQEGDVSVYDITEHADFVFNTGDVVVRVAMDDSVITQEDKERNALPCVGQVAIVDERGSVQIMWVDNTISSVKPQELYKVDPEDDNLSGDSSFGSDDEWETASDAESNDAADDDVSDGVIIVYPAPEPDTTGDDETEGTGHEGEEVSSDVNNRVNELLSQKNPGFLMLESSPEEHACRRGSAFQPENPRRFMSCVKKEMALLQSALPPGILVRGYEDRMDLWSVQVAGPVGTPYEHGLFLFDVRLPPDYPGSPPMFHYLSQCSGRLNPNLYEDGKVCVSLLGTWTGKGSETWTSKSNLLQVLLSIQGLILCREPYYNEAGYEKQRGSVEGRENSRLYNEMVLLKLLQSMQRLVAKPPASFHKEILLHFAQHGPKIVDKFQSWIDRFYTPTPEALRPKETPETKGNENTKPTDDTDSQEADAGSSQTQQQITAKGASSECREHTEAMAPGDLAGAEASAATFKPDFPLFPLSKGFCMSLKRCLDGFKTALHDAQSGESSE